MTLHLDPNTSFSFTRLIAAPPQQVFEMFTDATHLDAWWGPDGFRNETHELDFSVGGIWRYTMHGPDGKDWPNWIRYREITPPTGLVPGRLIYDHGGEISEPRHFEGMISFEAQGDKTLLTLALVFPNQEARDATKKYGAVEGGRQTLARLDAYVTERTGS